MAQTFEYEIQGNYGPPHGWEMVCTEANKLDARAQLATYNEEEPNVPHRIRRVRAQDNN
jgi:hypothetical protein